MAYDFWKNKRVLITGHTGFKGAWLSLIMKKLGAEVTGVSLESETTPNLFGLLNIESQINHKIQDIRDLEGLKKVMDQAKPEIIFHMAAQSLVRPSYKSPVETYATNLMGTVHVMEAARSLPGLQGVTVITTDKCYENDDSGKSFKETDPMGGFDPYSNSKACAELAISSYRNSFFSEANIPLASVRAGNVIGGGDWCEDRLVPDVFRAIENDQSVVIRNPLSVRPWQHVLDPLLGYMKLTEKMVTTQDKNLQSGWNFGPLEEGEKNVEWILGEIKTYFSDFNWELEKGAQPHEQKLLNLDINKARTQLDWTPRFSVEKTMELTCAWYKAYLQNEDLGRITDEQISLALNR